MEIINISRRNIQIRRDEKYIRFLPNSMGVLNKIDTIFLSCRSVH